MRMLQAVSSCEYTASWLFSPFCLWWFIFVPPAASPPTAANNFRPVPFPLFPRPTPAKHSFTFFPYRTAPQCPLNPIAAHRSFQSIADLSFVCRRSRRPLFSTPASFAFPGFCPKLVPQNLNSRSGSKLLTYSAHCFRDIERNAELPESFLATRRRCISGDSRRLRCNKRDV